MIADPPPPRSSEQPRPFQEILGRESTDVAADRSVRNIRPNIS